jgi:hypothetical protein
MPVLLDSIHTMLQQMGVSKAAAQHFCETLLPPYHDCLLNYTLSCYRHNSQKVITHGVREIWYPRVENDTANR